MPPRTGRCRKKLPRGTASGYREHDTRATGRMRSAGPGVRGPTEGCLIRRGEGAGSRPHRNRVHRRLDQQPEGVPLRRACGRAVRPHPIDGRKHLAALQHERKLGGVASVSLNLEVHEPIKRNRRGHLTLDERIDVADVARHDRNETERTARVAPRQSSGHSEFAAIADSASDEGWLLAPPL
jgi:hypothetical protein